MNARDLVKIIRASHDPKCWGIVEELGDGVGFQCRRHADIVAFGLWPSRGLVIKGYEIKCARSDWLRELEKPEKAEAIAQYCDEWWIVAANDKIVRDGELPPNWGLMIPGPTGDILNVVTPPKELEPKPINRAFLAAIVRRFSEQYVPNADVQPQIQEAVERGQRSAVTGDRLASGVKAFEEASGVKIANAWNHGDIGKAVQLIVQFGPDEWKQQYRSYFKNLLTVCNEFRKGLQKIDPELAKAK